MDDFPQRWNSARLAELMGATRKWVLTCAIPRLEAAGAIRKMGRGYVGRRSDIEAALLSASA